jgi:hypothetical protein
VALGTTSSAPPGGSDYQPGGRRRSLRSAIVSMRFHSYKGAVTADAEDGIAQM